MLVNNEDNYKELKIRVNNGAIDKILIFISKGSTCV